MNEYCNAYLSNQVKINLEMVFADKFNFLFLLNELEKMPEKKYSKDLIESLKEIKQKLFKTGDKK